MKIAEFVEGLKSIGLPIAYDHFSEGSVPALPYIVYLLPNSSNFSADGIAFHQISEVDIELYCEDKDFSVEEKIEKWLTENIFYFDKTEEFIETEKMYLIKYETSI